MAHKAVISTTRAVKFEVLMVTTMERTSAPSIVARVKTQCTPDFECRHRAANDLADISHFIVQDITPYIRPLKLLVVIVPHNVVMNNK